VHIRNINNKTILFSDITYRFLLVIGEESGFCVTTVAFTFLIPPATILYSNSRHSIAPLNKGVLREADKRIDFGRRASPVRK
jgi:hypothetical protein